MTASPSTNTVVLLDEKHVSPHHVTSTRRLCCLDADSGAGRNLPLRQAGQVIPLRTGVDKGRHAEPRRMPVLLAPVVAGDGVLDDFPACARGPDLRCRGQVADERDLGDVAGGRGAECTAGTPEKRGGGRGVEAAGEERQRHRGIGRVG